jgi:hypothetical protein
LYPALKELQHAASNSVFNFQPSSAAPSHRQRQYDLRGQIALPINQFQFREKAVLKYCIRVLRKTYRHRCTNSRKTITCTVLHQVIFLCP